MPPTPSPFLPPPFPPVPLLPGKTDPNDARQSSVCLSSRGGSHGWGCSSSSVANGLLVAGTVDEPEGIGAPMYGMVVQVSDTGGMDMGREGMKGEVSLTMVGAADVTGELIVASTFRGGLFATLGGTSPVSCAYKSFQYLISP